MISIMVSTHLAFWGARGLQDQPSGCATQGFACGLPVGPSAWLGPPPKLSSLGGAENPAR